VKLSVVLRYGFMVVVVVALVFLTQAFIVRPYRIPSTSMSSTLKAGDRVLVNRFIYHFRAVRRGDIVVFKWPRNRKLTFIKRVIGLPGDKLLLSGGHLFINGVLQNEPYVARRDGQPLPTLAAPTMSGSNVAAPWSLQRSYKVPAGHYFMLGDNRAVSDDSRVWGTISKSDIIGAAFFIYWPFNRVKVL